MVSNGTRKERATATNNESAFIRQEDAQYYRRLSQARALLVGYMIIFLPACLIFHHWVRQ